MQTHFRSSLVRGVALIALTALMAGCEHSPQLSVNNNTGAPSCSNNPYLMKYNCSISRIQRAAENGNADAQYALGYMYYYGIDTVKDQQTGELWIQRSAAQGQPLAKKAWSLINSGAAFKDFHKAAADQVGQVSRNASTIVQQEPEDVTQLNSTSHAEPITNHLPGYHGGQATDQSSSASTDSVMPPQSDSTDTAAAMPKQNVSMSDPRLSRNAKPIVAKTHNHTTMAANTPSANPSHDYTVQLLASNKLSDVKSFAAQNKLGSQAHVYQTELDGKPWYMLTYGDFKTADSAEKAMEQLPSAEQKHNPWVKSFATLKKEVQLQQVIS
jgi:DamX protein